MLEFFRFLDCFRFQIIDILFYIAEPPDESIDETACRGVF